MLYRNPRTYFAFIVGQKPLPGKPHTRLAQCAQGGEGVRNLLLGAGYPADNVVTVLDGNHSISSWAAWARFTRLGGAVGCHVVVFFAGGGVSV